MPEPALTVLFDQNVPVAVAEWLRSFKPGWIVHHVKELGLSGAPDGQIYRWAQGAGAMIVTFDEDFADSRTYKLGHHHGVVRLRVWPTTVEVTIEALTRLFRQVPQGDLSGSLVVIDDRKIRIRKI